MLIISICTILSFISVSQGDDFFESLSYRSYCYGDKQCGCNEEFTDRYPDLAWSYSKLTKADTHFYLFTRKSPEKPELLHKCGGELPPDTTFDPNCTTEIYLPGFTSGICNFAIYRELKNERLKCGCFNVILLDWMWGNKLDLMEAKENMRIVAKQLAIIINNLKNKYGLGPNDFILTGQSYGAHMASFVANETKVGIINGIDPAGVVADFAENAPNDGKLDKGDADCVNVLHTNGGQCLPGAFGINYTAGTADFWYNDGLNQPACKKQICLSLLKFDWFYALITLYPAACSHLQSLYYYKASMDRSNSSCTFTAVKCDSLKGIENGSCVKDCGSNGQNCALAGAYGCQCLNASQPTWPNNYYLSTNCDCPYCNDTGTMNTDAVQQCTDLNPCKRPPPSWSSTPLPLTTPTVTTPRLTNVGV